MAPRLGIDGRQAAGRALHKLHHIWRAVPEGIRASPAARTALRHARAATGLGAAEPRVVRTLEEVDEQLARLE